MQPVFRARLSHGDYNYLPSNDQPSKITVFMLCLENNVLLQIGGSFACKRASLTVLEQMPFFSILIPLFIAHFTLGKLGWMLRRQCSLPMSLKMAEQCRVPRKPAAVLVVSTSVNWTLTVWLMTACILWVNSFSPQPNRAARVAASSVGGSSKDASCRLPIMPCSGKKRGVKGLAMGNTAVCIADEILPTGILGRLLTWCRLLRHLWG